MYYADNILSFTGLPFTTVYAEYAAYGRMAWQWNFYKNLYAVASCDAGYFKNYMELITELSSLGDDPEAFEQFIHDAEVMESNKLDTWFVPDNFIMGAGLSLGYKTPIGPIEIQVSKANKMKDWNLFVNVGYWF